MRFLHTSDWHLGQVFHNFERSHEHQVFLNWLLDTAEAEQADALLVCGDVFDNANPSAASQRQLYQFLKEARTRMPAMDIVLIAGNHDSPGRLEAPGPLLSALGVSVVGQVTRGADGAIDLERLVLPLRGKDGAVAAWCLAIPFLRPGDVPRVEAAADPYMEGIALLYRQALDLALRRRQPGQAILALGHCHMLEGQISADSERRIVVGGAEALPDSAFDPAIAYAALGHLHLAQAIGKSGHRRYCGSPLPLSFAEIGYRHQVLRVDLEGEAVAAVTPLPVPRAVELLRVPAEPAPADDALAALAALPERDGISDQARPYLEVRVRLEEPEPGLRARIEAALQGKAARLARIDISYPARAAGADAPHEAPERLERMQPDDIFRRLYRDRFASEAPPEQLAAFAELVLAAATEGQP